MARIVDRAGVELVSVGDTVGINLWGQPNPLEVTMDQMLVVCQAVRRGVLRALLSSTSRSAPSRRVRRPQCEQPSGSSRKPASTW